MAEKNPHRRLKMGVGGVAVSAWSIFIVKWHYGILAWIFFPLL